MLTKVKKAIYTASAGVLSLPAVTLAQWGGASDYQGDSQLDDTTIWELIQKLMQWLLYILGFIAIIAFVISGIMYLTAAGDETRAEKAKSAMLYAIIGIIVALIGLIAINAIDTWLGNANRF